MRSAPYSCCFCKKNVLGLHGKDVFLDSFYMDESEDAKFIIKNNLIGYAHWNCLIKTKFHRFWLNKFKDLFLKESKVKYILNEKEKIFAFDEVNNEYFVCDGQRFLIFEGLINLKEIIQNKRFVYQEQEISLNMSLLEIQDQLQSKFTGKNFCNLSEFDLQNLEYEIEFLSNVNLKLREPLEASIFIDKDGFEIFEGLIQYPIILPNQILNGL